VDGQALGVAHVGQVAEELEVSMNCWPARNAALDAKAQDGADALGQILLGQFVVGWLLRPG
jgi:hypothetical protein